MSTATTTNDLDSALQLIARRAQSLTLASGAAIALTWPEDAPSYAQGSDVMSCRASAGDDAPGVGTCLRVGSGFSGECVREGKWLRCDDSETDARVDRASCRTLGIRSMVAVPVKDGESVLGIIEIFSPQAKAFTQSDVTTLQGLAQQVARAVEAAQHVASVPDIPHPPERVSQVSGPVHLPPETVPKLLSPVHTPPNLEFFGNHVFVSSAVPWSRFLQSGLWHLVALAALWNLSHGWAIREEILRRTPPHTYLTDYKPASPFPTAGSYRPARTHARVRSQSAPQPAIVVRAGTPPHTILPPAVKLPAGGRLNLVSWNPKMPPMPRSPTPAAPALDATLPRTASFASSAPPVLMRASIVGPPPQVGAAFGRHAVAAPNSLVLAPPPIVEFRIRTGGKVSIGRPAVVGPPPGMPSREQSNISAMTWGGKEAVVGPAPAMPIHEPSNTSAVTLGGAGAVVVPPPPSLTGSASLDHGRAASRSRVGSEIVIPSPSIAGTAVYGGRIPRAAMNIPSTVTPLPPRKIEEASGPGPQELPLRLIGLALALPSSSYFSNYEVFIAERRIGKEESRLIKLVYESRPYQRRVSEYALSDSRVYKLRVTRDATCDETASQVVGNQRELQASAKHRGLRAIDGNTKLPCYRTTVDEYRKAISRVR